VYAGWGFSQAFYRERIYDSVLGFKGLEEFMTGFWEAWALSKGLFLPLRVCGGRLLVC